MCCVSHRSAKTFLRPSLERARHRAIPDPEVRVYRVAGSMPVSRGFGCAGSTEEPGPIRIDLYQAAPPITVFTSPKAPSSRYPVKVWTHPVGLWDLAVTAYIEAASLGSPYAEDTDEHRAWMSRAIHEAHSQDELGPPRWLPCSIAVDGAKHDALRAVIGRGWAAVTETTESVIAVAATTPIADPSLELVGMPDNIDYRPE